MAGRADIMAGSAFVKLYLKDDMTRGLKSAMSTAISIGAAAVSSMASGFSAAVNEFVKVGSELHDASGRTGIAATKLAALKFAAEQTGSGLSQLEMAAKSLVKNGFDPNDFEKIAARVAVIENPVERSREAIRLFGKSGMALLPMIQELSSLTEGYRAMGPMLSEEDIKAADDLGDAWNALQEVFNHSVLLIGASLAPELKNLTNTAIGAAVSINRILPAFSAAFHAAAAELGANLPTLDEYRKIGEQVTNNMAEQTDRSRDLAESLKEQAKAAKDAARELAQMDSLLRGFETPGERFSRIVQEIRDASAKHPERGAELDEALRRVTATENKRLADEREKALKRDDELNRRTRNPAGVAIPRRGATFADMPKDEIKKTLTESTAASVAATAGAALALQSGAGPGEKLLDFHRKTEMRRKTWEDRMLAAVEKGRGVS